MLGNTDHRVTVFFRCNFLLSRSEKLCPQVLNMHNDFPNCIFETILKFPIKYFQCQKPVSYQLIHWNLMQK